MPLLRGLRVPLGRIAGIRFGLHASWFLVFAFVVWATGSGFASIYPGMGGLERVAIAVTIALAFFAWLAAHEFDHALVSRRLGIRVRGITLFLFGGVAEIEGEIDRPGAEFAVALGGPAVSLVLASLFGLVAVAASDRGWRAVEAGFGALTLFNLVPGLPLDGGRLLRAAVWRLSGDRRRATRIAAGGGRIVAVALALLGFALALRGDPAGLWYVPMGAFLWVLAGSSARAVPAPQAALALPREGEAPQPGP